MSEGTLHQLTEFFRDQNLQPKRIHAFFSIFSMVQGVKSLHSESMDAMSKAHGKRLLTTRVSFASDVERMGMLGAPRAGHRAAFHGE